MTSAVVVSKAGHGDIGTHAVDGRVTGDLNNASPSRTIKVVDVGARVPNDIAPTCSFGICECLTERTSASIGGRTHVQGGEGIPTYGGSGIATPTSQQ